MAELAYAHDSGSCPRKWVRVQVPSTALNLRAKSVEKSMLLALVFFKTVKQRIKKAAKGQCAEDDMDYRETYWEITDSFRLTVGIG